MTDIYIQIIVSGDDSNVDDDTPFLSSSTLTRIHRTQFQWRQYFQHIQQVTTNTFHIVLQQFTPNLHQPYTEQKIYNIVYR